MITPPLILSQGIEKEAAIFFNSLRQKNFPPSRNYIDAHLSLFHALPNNAAIIEYIEDVCRLQKPFSLRVEKPVSIGKGVAFKIESDELLHLHRTLQNKWFNFLSPQDRQKLWPHITVQNKVPLPEARELLNELTVSFTPYSLLATGLQLWEYLNGPWKLVRDFYFQLPGL